MKQTILTALIVAALTLLASLVYNRVPGLPTPEQPRQLSATSTEETGGFGTGGATSSPSVEIGERRVRVSIADTKEERERGLGGRESLAPDEGMLFIFPEDGRYGFWMKDMRFSLDIVWLSNDGRIVDMEQNVAPETYPGSVFVSNVPARYVLELPAGFVEKYTVRVGDMVRL